MKIRGGQAGRTAIFAIPRVDHFVRQQEGAQFSRLFVDEKSFGLAIIAGFMMFEAKVGDVIAEREQEVIGAIMARPKQCASLAYKLREMAAILRFHLEGSRAVGHEVQEVRRLGA